MIGRLIICIILSCACAVAQAQDMYIKTIAGCCSGGGFGGDNGPAIDAKLLAPEGINLDRKGNLLIAEYGNNRIRQVSLSTGIITTIVGTGTVGYGGDGSSATDATLSGPEDVFVKTNGDILIADGYNNAIREVNVVTGIITTIIGTGSAGSLGDGGLATNAELNFPVSVRCDQFENIYVAELYGNRIRKINAATGIITTVAGTGATGSAGNGGLAINAELNQPNIVAVDSIGNILISDDDAQLRRVDVSTGIISAFAGTGTAGYSGDGGLAIDAELNAPARGALDVYGNVYFSDWGNAVIRKIDGKTGIITTIAGDDTVGFSGDGGPATAARLGANGVILDSAGTVYISDEGNNRVRVLYSPLAVSPSPAIPDIAVYPNPVTNVLNIEHAQGCELNICNLLDLPVFHAKILSEQWAGDISALPDGVYIAQFTDEYGAIVSKKIVKE